MARSLGWQDGAAPRWGLTMGRGDEVVKKSRVNESPFPWGAQLGQGGSLPNHVG
jgi:hypothetical protein